MRKIFAALIYLFNNYIFQIAFPFKKSENLCCWKKSSQISTRECPRSHSVLLTCLGIFGVVSCKSCCSEVLHFHWNINSLGCSLPHNWVIVMSFFRGWINTYLKFYLFEMDIMRMNNTCNTAHLPSSPAAWAHVGAHFTPCRHAFCARKQTKQCQMLPWPGRHIAHYSG